MTHIHKYDSPTRHGCGQSEKSRIFFDAGEMTLANGRLTYQAVEALGVCSSQISSGKMVAFHY